MPHTLCPLLCQARLFCILQSRAESLATLGGRPKRFGERTIRTRDDERSLECLGTLARPVEAVAWIQSIGQESTGSGRSLQLAGQCRSARVEPFICGHGTDVGCIVLSACFVQTVRRGAARGIESICVPSRTRRLFASCANPISILLEAMHCPLFESHKISSGPYRNHTATIACPPEHAHDLTRSWYPLRT